LMNSVVAQPLEAHSPPTDLVLLYSLLLNDLFDRKPYTRP
jgi:hypothetical protein